MSYQGGKTPYHGTQGNLSFESIKAAESPKNNKIIIKGGVIPPSVSPQAAKCHLLASSSSVLIAFAALRNLARCLHVCVSACVRSCLRLQGETKALCHCWASVEQDAKLAEGTVTRLSVRSDPFQLQASLSAGDIRATARRLEASHNKRVECRQQKTLLQHCQQSVNLSLNSGVLH